jgi:rod shape determining protein RodA
VIDRRLLRHVDWLVLLLAASIAGIGVVTVSSATSGPMDTGLGPLAWKQLLWVGLGLLGAAVALWVDYRKLERYAYAIYVAVMVLLVLVPAIGYIGGGSRRWIRIGVFTLQPSELAKLALVLVLARFFHRDAAREAYRLRDLVWPALLFLLPAGSILVQPDLGTVVVLGLIFASMVLVAGIRLRSLAWFALFGALALFVAGPQLWSHLKPYQQKRIVTFLDPGSDPLGAGYHIIQSKIAVGSGKVWGKGYRRGTQNRLHFLPEQHTDFIFSVFAEEWGFFACAFLLVLYFALVWRGLQVASRAKDRFGALLAFGVTATIFWQVFVNVGMTTGMLPVVGITLPFFSYGGSSMITLWVGLGLVANVAMRRFTF